MRRIDALAIAIAVPVAGGVVYGILSLILGDSLKAGVWTQVLLAIAFLGWVLSYLLRVVTQNMTYNRQLEDYETAVLQKRLDEMSPEELEKLQAELEQEQGEKNQEEGG